MTCEHKHLDVVIIISCMKKVNNNTNFRTKKHSCDSEVDASKPDRIIIDNHKITSVLSTYQLNSFNKSIS